MTPVSSPTDAGVAVVTGPVPAGPPAGGGAFAALLADASPPDPSTTTRAPPPGPATPPTRAATADGTPPIAAAAAPGRTVAAADAAAAVDRDPRDELARPSDPTSAPTIPAAIPAASIPAPSPSPIAVGVRAAPTPARDTSRPDVPGATTRGGGRGEVDAAVPPPGARSGSRRVSGGDDRGPARDRDATRQAKAEVDAISAAPVGFPMPMPVAPDGAIAAPAARFPSDIAAAPASATVASRRPADGSPGPAASPAVGTMAPSPQTDVSGAAMPASAAGPAMADGATMASTGAAPTAFRPSRPPDVEGSPRPGIAVPDPAVAASDAGAAAGHASPAPSRRPLAPGPGPSAASPPAPTGVGELDPPPPRPAPGPVAADAPDRADRGDGRAGRSDVAPPGAVRPDGSGVDGRRSSIDDGPSTAPTMSSPSAASPAPPPGGTGLPAATREDPAWAASSPAAGGAATAPARAADARDDRDVAPALALLRALPGATGPGPNTTPTTVDMLSARHPAGRAARTGARATGETDGLAVPPRQPVPGADAVSDAVAPRAGATLAADGGGRQLAVARHAAWADGIARDIATAATGDEARFTVASATLGPVHVGVTRSGDGAAVTMVVSGETARDVLADARPALVAEASARGLHIRDARVELAVDGAAPPPPAPPPPPQPAQHSLTHAGYAGTGSGAGDGAGRQAGEQPRPRDPPPAPAPRRKPAAATDDGLYA